MMRILALLTCLAGVARADVTPPRAYQRVESLGVEVRAPADADVLAFVELANVSWHGPSGECLVQIAVAHSERNLRFVGTLPLTCYVVGAGCGSPCDELRAVPGGPAAEPYPRELPRVEIDSAWSDRSEDHAGVLLFADGTVQFHGARCAGFRGRRRKLPAARVAALVDELDHRGLFDHRSAPESLRDDPMCEHSITDLYLRSPARSARLRFHCQADPTVAAALQLINSVAGRNPCLK